MRAGYWSAVLVGAKRCHDLNLKCRQVSAAAISWVLKSACRNVVSTPGAVTRAAAVLPPEPGILPPKPGIFLPGASCRTRGSHAVLMPAVGCAASAAEALLGRCARRWYTFKPGRKAETADAVVAAVLLATYYFSRRTSPSCSTRSRRPKCSSAARTIAERSGVKPRLLSAALVSSSVLSCSTSK